MVLSIRLKNFKKNSNSKILDLLTKELNKLGSEINLLIKKFTSDFLIIKENIDYIKAQNTEILKRISKLEEINYSSDPKNSEILDNINKKLTNIENKDLPDIGNLVENLTNLTLSDTGKEKINRKISTIFYKYE